MFSAIIYSKHTDSDQIAPNGAVGINCAPLLVDFFLFYRERDFMVSLSDNDQADVILLQNI